MTTVIVRTYTPLGVILSAPPMVEVRQYRWRWMARHAVWFVNNVPPWPLPIWQVAELVDGSNLTPLP